MKTLIKKLLEEALNERYILYHGTSSGYLDVIKTKTNKLFLTTDKNVATYYAAKGGEKYFIDKEIEFETKFGESPDEYFNTQENGELPMFKALYPKNEKPIVIEFKIPKPLIKNINDFQGYKGGELIVNPKYISKIISIDWDELDF